MSERSLRLATALATLYPAASVVPYPLVYTPLLPAALARRSRPAR